MKKKNFKIGIIAPPFTTVPPKGQGGTERITQEIIEGLSGGARAILSEYYKIYFNSKKCDPQADFVYKIEIINNKLKKKRILK